MYTEDKPSLEELAHHGVKGMKWGVRRERRLQLHQRVASGNASKLDKVRAGSQASALGLIRDRGSLQKISQHKAQGMEQRKQRILSGEAKARDILAQYGGDRFDFGIRKKS